MHLNLYTENTKRSPRFANYLNRQYFRSVERQSEGYLMIHYLNGEHLCDHPDTDTLNSETVLAKPSPNRDLSNCPPVTAAVPVVTANWLMN